MKKLVLAVLSVLLMATGRVLAYSNSDYYGAGNDIWVCSSTATLILNGGLTTGTTGLLLNNPYGSGVNLVIAQTDIAITASPTGAATFELAWSSGNVQSTTNGNLITGVIGISSVTAATGNATAPRKFAGNCWVAGTMPAAQFLRPLGGVTGASSISPFYISDKTYPPGNVVIPPGSTVSLQASAAISELASFTIFQVPQ